jgi:Zn ribbon nucleic-acid-binding protein
MSNKESHRLERERRTIGAMIALYCRDRHGGSALCPECEEMHRYAMKRLDKCPFGEEKTTCVNCRVHCYKADMRERIRDIMRYAGPRMLWRHPWLAVMHIVDGKMDGRRQAHLDGLA